MNVENKPIKIVLFGRTGSGKSSLGNKLAGDNSLFTIGETLNSQTSKTVSKTVVLADAPLFRITIIDTPGFADNRVEITNEYLLANILSFLQDLGDGFNIGIYCLAAGTRVDAHNIEELRLIGTLLGQNVFKHTFIAITQANNLEGQARRKIYQNYPIDLPQILEQNGIFGFGPQKILFADFDNFNERFVKPLTKIMENSSLYQPQISQRIDVHDPGSIKRFLATPEMQEIISHYEGQLANQGREIEGLRTLMIQKAEESSRLIEKGREELDMYRNNLEYTTQQLSNSQNLSKELQKNFEDYQKKQAEELDRVTNDLHRQQENARKQQEMIHQKEHQLSLLNSRIEELGRARQAAVDNSHNSTKTMWGTTLIGLVEKIGSAIIGKFFS